MLDTQLVLVEGPPGSGKSTTAQRLAAEIAQAGQACRCYLEWDADHPIPIGEDLQLRQVIATARAREGDMLRRWQAFAQARQAQDSVSVLESRFWQTSVMLMYVAGCSADEVLASNRRVIEAIQGLRPVLIYLAIGDLKAFVTRTIQLKEEEWRRAGLPGSWAQHIYDGIDGQPWMTERGVSGLPGYLALLDEWAHVTDRLYDQLPFPKLTVHNPQQDWAGAMQQMRGFLGLI